MRFLVIGDPHFREGCVKDMELFIEETLRIVTEVRLEIEFVVVLGDVMDRHGILHQKPFHQSCRFLIELSKLRPTYCLIGNHDFDIPSVYLPENHPYKVMVWNEVPNLKIIDRPQIIDGIFFTPYVPPGYFTKAVKEAVNDTSSDLPWWELLNNRGIRLGFAHQEFKGCQMGLLKSESGDAWPQDSKVGEVPFIISGHIHSYQMLGENIMYTGTPVQVNYGEGDKKGLCVINVDNNKVEKKWYKVKVPKKLVKVIQLTELDKWVDDRFGYLTNRYNIDITKYRLTKKKGKQIEDATFDTIITLNSNKNLMDELRTHVNNDRYLDSYKVQVLVKGRLPGVAIKNTIMKLKDMPLSITHIYINEIADNRDDDTRVEDVQKINWLEILIDRLKCKNGDQNPKLDMLRDILNDLTNKI